MREPRDDAPLAPSVPPRFDTLGLASGSDGREFDGRALGCSGPRRSTDGERPLRNGVGAELPRPVDELGVVARGSRLNKP
ncbi:MAG: hypothetical protein KDA55_12385 [Planctomycetales bacterium]|nr:hypothetical protein [Planctomycetales bacterium]